MVENKIKEFLETKPEVVDVIGYGSGVIAQNGYTDNDKKQIDLIVTVNSIIDYHKENYNNHSEEYSKLGYNLVNLIQNLGTDVNYISNIEHNDDTFKMGIIERHDLIIDLLYWKNFFMAGRCQKPITLIETSGNLKDAIDVNRLNALRLALILNYDKQLTQEELFRAICSLSYIGDIRMNFKCENPNKVKNIVNASIDEYTNMYTNEDLYIVENGHININKDKLVEDVSIMPWALFNNLDGLSKENLESIRDAYYKKIQSMNKVSSTCQPVKSIILNGCDKSFKYFLEKVKKGRM